MCLREEKIHSIKLGFINSALYIFINSHLTHIFNDSLLSFFNFKKKEITELALELEAATLRLLFAFSLSPVVKIQFEFGTNKQ